jgi:hypothetical protein
MKTKRMDGSRWWKLWVIATIATLGLAGANAESAAENPATPRGFEADTASISPVVKQKILEHMKQTNLERLKGWPGIIFYCPVEEERNESLKAVCSAIVADIGSLMAERRIPFQIAKNGFDLHFLPHITGRLLLIVELVGTEPGAQPSAIFAKVKALAHYAHAVNWSSELYPDSLSKDTKSPLEVPQHVDAILWERNLIAAASGDQSVLIQRVKAGVEEKLKDFLTEYNGVNEKSGTP